MCESITNLRYKDYTWKKCHKRKIWLTKKFDLLSQPAASEHDSRGEEHGAVRHSLHQAIAQEQ